MAVTDEDVEAACAGKTECAKDLADYKAATNTIRSVEPQLATMPESTRTIVKGLLDQAFGNRQRIVDDLRRRAILLRRDLWVYTPPAGR